MECNKCEYKKDKFDYKKDKCGYKTDNIEEMEKHLKEKHKIETFLKYSKIEDRTSIDKIDDLNNYELQVIREAGLLMDCEFCGKTGMREDIPVNLLEKILLLKARCFTILKTTEGYFAENETKPEWVCPECYKREKTKIKYWDFYKKLLKMQKDMYDAESDKEDEIIKKSIFSSGTWEEFEYLIDYEKKIKGKKRLFQLMYYDNTIRWGYITESEHGKYLTSKQIEEIENAAKEVHKKISEENDKISKKYRSKLRVIPVDYDECYLTYRKDFKEPFRDEVKSVLFTVEYYPENYDEYEVREILQSYNTKLGNKSFEVYITEDKEIYEYVWRLSEENIKKPYPTKITRKEVIGSKSKYNFEIYDEVIKEIEAKINDIRQLLTLEKYEINITFANKELRIFKKEHKEKSNIYEKTEIFGLETRTKHEHGSYSQEKDLDFYKLKSLIQLFEKEKEWIEKINEKIVLPGKINKVGENSRHIILGKGGLKTFFKYSVEMDPPDDTDIKIEYSEGKIVITKLKQKEIESLNLTNI